jgi:hypothetical protein
MRDDIGAKRRFLIEGRRTTAINFSLKSMG